MSTIDEIFGDDSPGAGERKAIAEREAHLTRIEQDDFKWLASHKQGRRIIYRLLAFCGTFHNPFNQDGSITAFHCGRMSVGPKYWADLQELCPERFEEMVTEHKDYDKQLEQRGKSKQ